MKKKLLILMVILAVLIAGLLTACNPKEASVDSIKIHTEPTTVYVKGQPLKLSGGQVLVIFDDKTENIIPITPEMISNFDPNTVGEQILQISYKGKTTTIKVFVLEAEIESVSLISMGAKTEYIEEQLLSLEGLLLKVVQENGEEELIPVTPNMVTGFNSNKVGEQTLNISYKRNEKVYLLEYKINVVAKKLTNISIHQKPTKQIYYLGDAEPDLTGGILNLEYDNGYPQKVSMKELPGLTSQWDNSTVSKLSKVTITYGGKITSFNVEIVDKGILEFEVLSYPTHFQLVNTPLNLEGLSVRLTYTNGQSEVVSVPDKNVYYEENDRDPLVVYSIMAFDYDTSKVGEGSVTLGFYLGNILLDNMLELDIVVHDKSIIDIEVYRTLSFDDDNLPLQEKTIYSMTTFRPYQEWSFVLLFDNGEKSLPMPLTNGMLSDNSSRLDYLYVEEGDVSLTVEYNDDRYTYEGIYTFTVTKLDITEVELLEKIGEQYINKDFIRLFLGNELDTTGHYLRVILNSGEVRIIPFSRNMVIAEEFDNHSLETTFAPINIQIADLNLNGRGEIPVVVIKKVVGNLTVTQQPLETNYVLFNADDYDNLSKSKYEFDPRGLEILLRFEGESETTTVTNFGNDWVFSSEEWTNEENYGKFYTLGQKTIYITYVGLESPEQRASITVNVTNSVTEISFTGYSLGTVYAGGEINLTNQTIEVIYENGRVDIVPITRSMLDYRASDTTEEESRAVTITYKRDGQEFKTGTFVRVLGNEAMSLEILQLPYTLEYVYQRAQALDLNGLVVGIKWRNGTIRELSPNEYQCENFSSENLGDILITVRDNQYNFTESFTVTIVEAVVESISWVGTPPSAVIQQGEDFLIEKVNTPVGTPISGYKVKIIFSDEREEEVSLQSIADQITIPNFNKSSATTQYVELVYKDKHKLIIQTEVQERALTQIRPLVSQLSVIEFSELDLTGVELELEYDNGITKNIVPLVKEHIEYNPDINPGGYDREDITLGIRTVSVVYMHNNVPYTTHINVRVVAKDLNAIDVGVKPKTQYIEGEEFRLDGGTAILYFNNGTTETLDLNSATLNNPNATFNINTNRFNNGELSGPSKLQTIFINYTYNGRLHQTSYDIIMQDRKYAQINFDSQNVYSFFYGDITPEKAPKFTVNGYNSFSDKERLFTFENDLFVVEYIRVEDRNSPRDPYTDYTALPREVGEYIVVVSYDSSQYGDMVHNSFVDESQILTIRKKRIILELDDVQKVYGTSNPLYQIRAYGTDSLGNKDTNVSPFAYDDDFHSSYFASQMNNFGSVCYDENGRAINYLNIQAYNPSGGAISIGEGTNAGNYRINISGIESRNYEVTYVTSQFVISRRPVAIYPQSISSVYGNVGISITYTASKVLDENNNIIEDSGVYGDDVFSGALDRVNATVNSVGKYRITLGSLNNSSNPNYNIIFNPGGEDQFVSITPRNIYVKVNNITTVYGNPLGGFSVSYYRDEACTDPNAFAYNDGVLGLGTVNYVYDNSPLPNVGTYDIDAFITTPIPVDPSDPNEEANKIITANNNYKIIYIKGLAEVDKRPIIVNAQPASKIYWESDPQEFVFETLGLEGNKDSGLAVINTFGELDTLRGQLIRQKGESVGRYSINIGTLAEENRNYHIIYNSASFTINQKHLFVMIDDSQLNKIYDGKVPSVTDYAINHIVDGEMQAYDNMLFNRSDITITFRNPSRNVGSYYAEVSNINTNFVVSFPQGVQYYYVIEQLEVDIEYINLPHNKEYNGEVFTYYAEVPRHMLQKEYNPDGSIKTDDNNNEITDIIDVTLNSVEPRDAGTYIVRPERLSDINYKLSESALEPQEFTILPRTLIVEVFANNGDTYEVTYNSQSAVLRENTHYKIHNNLQGSNVTIDVRVENPEVEGSKIGPTNVYYDQDGVTILSYNIVADNPTNKNYTVSFLNDKQYKYKILPRNIKVIFDEKNLIKDYDGQMPSIGQAAFYFAEITNISKNSISFEYIRENDDGSRSNSDAGTYAIIIHSTDKNHIVSTDKVYTYTIRKAVVRVELQSLSKDYDGKRAIIQPNNVVWPNSLPQASRPILRNYLNDAELNQMQENFDELRALIFSFRNEMSTLSFEVGSIEYSIAKCEESIRVATSIRNDIQEKYKNYLQLANYNNMLFLIGEPQNPATNTIIEQLNQVIASLRDENLNDARTYLSIVLSRINDIYKIVESECTYVAFKLVGNDPEAKSIGAYSVVMKHLDFNREYVLGNIGATYRIDPKLIIIRTEDIITSKYGDAIPESVPYTVWTSSGEQIPLNDLIGNLVVDFSTGQFGVYGVDEFDITADNEMKTANTNYSIDFRLGKYVVEKVDITIQLNLNAGTLEDTLYQGSNKLISYGDIISVDRIMYWEYVEGLVAPQPGQPIDSLESVVDSSIASFNCYMPDGTLIPSIGSARLSAGIYEVRAEGFFARNYNFIINSGKLTVNKKALTFYKVDNHIQRIYGSHMSVAFVGFAYNDTMAVLGENFIPPQPKDPNSEAFQLTTDAGNTFSNVEFVVHEDDKEQFENYYFDVEGLHQVKVVKAPLRLRVNSSTGNGLRATYGDNADKIDHIIQYFGFKNNDESVLGNNFPTLNFRKNVGDTGMFDESRVTFSTAQSDAFKNYDIIVEPVEFIVTPKELTIKFNKAISIMYDPEADDPYRIEPYFAKFEVGQNSVSANVLGGQYGNHNFVFGEFGWDDNAESLFLKYEFEVNPDLEDEEIKYLDYTSMFRHSLQFQRQVGEGQSIRLSGFEFASAETPNYILVYPETILNVYSKVTEIRMDEDRVMLEGDSFQNMSVITITEAASLSRYNVGDSGFSYSIVQDPVGGDKNGLIRVNYNRTYSLNNYDGPSSINMDMYDPVVNITSSIVSNVQNGQVSDDIPVRIYNRGTEVKEVNLEESGSSYYYGSLIDASSTFKQVLDISGKNYDKIDTSLRLVPYGDFYRFDLIINSNLSQTNRLVLSITGGIGQGGMMVTPTMNGVAGAPIPISVGEIDLFDGYTHNLRVYYNKLTNVVSVEVDGYLSIIRAVLSDTDYIPQENSAAGFTITGAKAWIRHFVPSKLGYLDNFGTDVKSLMGNPNILYISDITQTLNLELMRFFTPSTPAAPSYEHQYYLNGALVGTVGYEGGSVYVSGLRAGLHLAELVVMEGVTEISRGKVKILITTAAQDIVINEEMAGVSTPIELYGYDYDPEGGNLLEMQNSVASMKKYPISKGDNGETNFRSLSISYKMEKATINGDYRPSPTDSYLILGSNNNSYTPDNPNIPANYFGIALGISHIYEDYMQSYYSTSLLVARNGIRYSTNIGSDINWGDGALYTVEIYYDSIANIGNTSFRIVIYRNNSMIRNLVVDSNYTFGDTGNRIAQSALSTLINTSKTASIFATDHRFTIYNVNMGVGNVFEYDYLVNGQYVQNANGYNAIGENSTITLSNALENPLLSNHNQTSIKFEASSSNLQSNNIRFFVASSEQNTNIGRGLVLTYNGSLDELAFSFYNGSTQYMPQKVAAGLNLLDGNIHTISVRIDTTRIAKNNAISNVNNFTYGTRYYISRVYITVDGVEYSNILGTSNELCIPYYNAMGGWLTQQGTASPSADVSSGPTFKQAFNYTSIALNNTSMNLYEFGVGYDSVIAHLD